MSQEAFRKIMEAPAAAIEATKEGIQASLTLSNILGDIGSELKRLGIQGQIELANAMFNGSAFVPYGPGQNPPTPEQEAPAHGLPAEAIKAPEPEQSQGMGM